MKAYSSWCLAAGMVLAASAFASGPAGQPGGGPSAQQAAERYIAAKLDCDNMSAYQKDLCLRAAEDSYKIARGLHS